VHHLCPFNEWDLGCTHPNEECPTHETAISQLETHASNCEQNADIQEHEGEHAEAANNRTNAADCRKAIEALQAQ